MPLSERAQRAHDLAEAQGRPGYIDPDTGLFVMTTAKLRAQGRCCGNGCRHCPYSADEKEKS